MTRPKTTTTRRQIGQPYPSTARRRRVVPRWSPHTYNGADLYAGRTTLGQRIAALVERCMQPKTDN